MAGNSNGSSASNVGSNGNYWSVTENNSSNAYNLNFNSGNVNMNNNKYYNYTHEMLERTFIKDTYSCIKKRGTHFGIERLRKHILSESRNYSRKCYVLKMDIRGYFMNINRQKLLEIATNSLNKMAEHKVGKYRKTLWKDIVDMDFVHYLTKEIILLNPINDCRFIGPRSDWDNLPYEKSMFHTPDNCGLPIGNLTSQLYSNVYLNVLEVKSYEFEV